MLRRPTLIALFATMVAAPLQAELRIETRHETRRIDAATPQDPVLTMIGNLAIGQLPTGTILTIVGERGLRVEFGSASSAGIPAGSVMLQRGDSFVILNPNDQTYWTLPSMASASAILSGAVRAQSSQPTGEFATVAGVRAERRTFLLTMNIPLPKGVTLPPGFPTTLMFEGESWVTDRFASYASALTAPLQAILPGPLATLAAQDGLAVRTITRSAQFGYEIESIVTKLEEMTVAPELFEIPTGYKEVPRPSPRLP
ncbi:MAG TPA: hypothetical protein VI485_29150 [Vicinamibacterales bacterium]|nr:hypothetical protein [Vicinamibacterales bacterium]